jgi:hypothetical protein
MITTIAAHILGFQSTACPARDGCQAIVTWRPLPVTDTRVDMLEGVLVHAIYRHGEWCVGKKARPLPTQPDFWTPLRPGI